jgi:hypothetical protein
MSPPALSTFKEDNWITANERLLYTLVHYGIESPENIKKLAETRSLKPYFFIKISNISCWSA